MRFLFIGVILGFIVLAYRPANAEPVATFAGCEPDYVQLPGGSCVPAALSPITTYDDLHKVNDKLDMIYYTVHQLESGGIQLFVNQCGKKADAVQGSAQYFLYFGWVSELHIICRQW